MGAGLAGAAGVAGALLRSTDASAQSIEGGFAVVSPASPADPTGTTDTANINEALASGYTALLTPGTFYVTQITFAAGYKLLGSGPQKGSGSPSSSLCSVLKAGSDTTSLDYTSMISIPPLSADWQISNLAINGQMAGGTQPYTSGVIYCPNVTGSLNNDYGSIYGVSIELSGGDAIYLGTNRSVIHVDHCWLYSNTAGNGINCQGSSNVISRCEISSNLNGFTVGEGMCRIIACDVSSNTDVGGTIGSSGVYVYGCSFDQNGQQGVVVNNNATRVSILARFVSNSLNTSGSYAHLDASLSAEVAGAGSAASTQKGGVTLLPGTSFLAQQFGDTQRVSYDIWTNGHTGYVNDYSTYDTVGAGNNPPYANEHIG
jgi:hypothetical protein